MTDKDTPEILDFKLIFYEHFVEDGIHSFDAELLEHDKDGDKFKAKITDVKVRTLTDPKKIFDWKIGKIYMLPVKPHSKLEGVYILLLKWKALVHPYLDDEEANPMKSIETKMSNIPLNVVEHEVIPSVGDDKQGKHGSEAKLSTRSEKIGEPVPKQTVLDEGSQSLTETTNVISCCDKHFMKDPKEHSPQCYKFPQPQDSYQMMDKRDEEQILAEIKGHMIEEYVYQFKAGGKLVTGVSYAGIKAMVVRRGGYEIISDAIIRENDYFLAKVKIQDKQLDLQGLGLGECYINEPFARQKAMGKALRNAYRSIMDEGQFIAFIKQWKNKKEMN